MQIFITIVTGITIFILSQYFLNFVLNPILEIKKIISKISIHLMYFNDYYYNMSVFYSHGKLRDDLLDDVRNDFLFMKKQIQTLTSQLNATRQSVLFYNFFRIFFFLPKSERLSNSINSLVKLRKLLSKDPNNFKMNYQRQIEDEIINIKTDLNID